jgi:hypothetical protein
MALDVPKVAAVPYHFNPVPVAVKATAAMLRQYAIGATTGADGIPFTCTSILALGPSQPFML